MSIIVRSNYWPFKVMDSLFDDTWEPLTLFEIPELKLPKLDIKEEDKEYIVSAEVPGFNKEDIKVELNDDVLTIASETKEEKEETKEGYIYKERSHRSFSRSFTVPGNLRPEEINAKLENGILTINLPKKEPLPAKKIEIKTPEEPKELEVKEPLPTAEVIKEPEVKKE